MGRLLLHRRQDSRPHPPQHRLKGELTHWVAFSRQEEGVWPLLVSQVKQIYLEWRRNGRHEVKVVAEALARSWQLSRPGSLTHREH